MTVTSFTRAASAFALLALVGLPHAPANASTINFGQFGADGTSLPNSITGTTTDGVGFTATGPGSGFGILQEGTSWIGEFPAGTPLLFDQDVPGAVTLSFNSPISGITDLAVQANAPGPYSATLIAYNGTTVLGTNTYSGTNEVDPTFEGTVPAFNFSAADITSIVLSTTDDGLGLALGGVGGSGGNVSYATAAPLPPAFLLFGTALLALVAFAWHRHHRGIA